MVNVGWSIRNPLKTNHMSNKQSSMKSLFVNHLNKQSESLFINSTIHFSLHRFYLREKWLFGKFDAKISCLFNLMVAKSWANKKCVPNFRHKMSIACGGKNNKIPVKIRIYNLKLSFFHFPPIFLTFKTHKQIKVDNSMNQIWAKDAWKNGMKNTCIEWIHSSLPVLLLFSFANSF